MIEIIAGSKGKGKTKILIERVNDDIKLSNGTIVYLDKNNKHMYELSNRVRLINLNDFSIDNYNVFLGFIYGIISENSDLDKIYLDNILSIAHLSETEFTEAIITLSGISAKYNIDMVISVSLDKSQISENILDLVKVAL